MCGIAGILDPGGAVDEELLNRMCQAIEHRGPDSCGTHREPGLAVRPARVGTAVLDGLAHPVEELLIDSASRIEDPGDSAHGSAPMEAERLHPAVDYAVRGVFAGDVVPAAPAEVRLVASRMPELPCLRREPFRRTIRK